MRSAKACVCSLVELRLRAAIVQKLSSSLQLTVGGDVVSSRYIPFFVLCDGRQSVKMHRCRIDIYLLRVKCR